MTQKITKKIIDSYIDIDKLKNFIQFPDPLSFLDILKISFWMHFDRKRFLYFYMLCETTKSNKTAFMTATNEDSVTIMSFINGKITT